MLRVKKTGPGSLAPALICQFLATALVVLPSVQFSVSHLHMVGTMAIVHWHLQGRSAGGTAHGAPFAGHSHSLKELLQTYGTQANRGLQEFSPQPVIYYHLDCTVAPELIEDYTPKVITGSLYTRSPPGAIPS